MGLTIKGERHYVWRAVEQDGTVLDLVGQRRRHKRAAKKFFRKLLKGLPSVPRVIVTDKVKSYGAAQRESLPGVAHRQHRSLNNHAENSHQPTRQREHRMQRLSLLVRPSGSLLPLVPSRNIFVRSGIGLPRPLIVKRGAKDSRAGRRSRL
jgi:putative transposase